MEDWAFPAGRTGLTDDVGPKVSELFRSMYRRRSMHKTH
jgi:hypothetical protein